ncbi:MAG: hypothetical protein JWM32_1544 [Verrucomicrobia bacterium]|nr:hypothetical protein [Verrucomicrobiota bacterium]
MNLSTSVELPDSPMPVSPPAGAAKANANADASTTGCPAVFSDLLESENVAPAVPAGKSPEERTKASAEAGAVLLAGWMAATTPVPVADPTVGEWSANPLTSAVDETGTSEPIAASEVPKEKGGWKSVGGRPFALTPSSIPGLKTINAVTSAPAEKAVGEKFLPTKNGGPEAETDAAVVCPAAMLPEKKIAPAIVDEPHARDALVETSVEADASVTTRLIPIQPRTPRPEARVSPDARSDGEKIAGPALKSLPTDVPVAPTEDKKILTAIHEHVERDGANLGIPVAIAGTEMKSNASNHPNAAALSLHGVVPTLVDQAVVQVSEVITGANVTSQAHHAVEAVLSAAERVGNSAKSSVQLNFSVGNADLSVRVELRDGAVHATFRTDSAELRSALATEWQSRGGDANQGPRVAEATFASASNGSGSFSTSSDGAQQQRDHGSRQSAGNFFRSASQFSSASTPEKNAPELQTARSRSDLNLYTFA